MENNEKEWQEFFKFVFGLPISEQDLQQNVSNTIRSHDMGSRSGSEPISCNLRRWLK